MQGLSWGYPLPRVFPFPKVYISPLFYFYFMAILYSIKADYEVYSELNRLKTDSNKPESDKKHKSINSVLRQLLRLNK